jgi:acyl-CoA synthetase (AMP-forming)/AMP-acid ligase II
MGLQLTMERVYAEFNVSLPYACFFEQIGSFALPEVIHWAPGLPKTRSGKIMRRILRKIAANQFDELGDTSSLADPAVVEQLVDSKRSMRIAKL